MKIEKNKLLKALEMVKPGLSTNEIIEQSTHFCFIKNQIVTYNDEISISFPLELDLEGAVYAKELYNFVAKASADELSLEISENVLIIKSKKSKASLVLQTNVTLPIEEIGKIKKWKTIPDNFIKSLSFCLEGCSKSNDKPIIQCVHVTSKYMESTDNYRICRYKLNSDLEVSDFLLRHDYGRNVINFKPVTISEGTGWIHFKNESGAVMSCRIFEEKFPELNKYLEVKGDSFEFPEEILSILERATGLANGMSFDSTVEISIEGAKMIVKSNSLTGSTFEEWAKISKSPSENLTFVVTPLLLKDILNKTKICKIEKTKIGFYSKSFSFMALLCNKI